MNRRAFLYSAGATTLLHSAEVCGATRMSRVVAEAMPNVTTGEAVEKDLFRKAVMGGDLNTVKRFVESDSALLYSRNAEGDSVYLLARNARQVAVAEYFLSRGLKLDFHETVASGHWKRVEEMLTANPGYALIHTPRGDFPSHVAVLAGQSEYLIQFVAYTRDFNAKSAGRHDRTPVHLAASYSASDESESLMQNLLQNGGLATSVDDEGNTPLHVCAANKNVFAAEMLLRKGANPRLRNLDGQTPLDIARSVVSNGVTPLLERSESIPRDYYMRRFAARRDGTPVERDDTQGLPQSLVNEFVIVSHFSADRMKKLLHQCPDLLNTRSSFDELAVEAGAHMGRQDIAGFLLDRGAPYSVCTAAMFGETSAVKTMLRDDPRRIHERGPHDFLLTFYPAFGTGSIELMEVLRGSGAQLEWNVRGRNPLHVAAEFGQLELCRYLVERGLDPRQKAQTFKGYLNAIELAQASKHPEIADALGRK